MPSLAEIEANILLASSTGNKPLLNSTLNNATPEQLSMVSVYAQALLDLTQLTDGTLAKTMTRSLMSKAGEYVDALAIGDAMVTYAQQGNYPALDALTDYLTPQQITDFGSSPAVGQSLLNIAANDLPGIEDDITIKGAVRNLFEKLGAQCDATAIGSAMVTFAANENYKALDAVTDYLTAQQKTDLGLTDAPSNTLNNIVSANDPFSTDDDSAISAAILNLMKKLGPQIDAESLGNALEMLSYGDLMYFPPLFDAIDAILNRLTSQQLADLGQTYHPFNIIANLIGSDFGFPDDDNTLLANAVGNAVKVLGDFIDTGNHIMFMSSAVLNSNPEVLKAIVDNLSPEKIAEFSTSSGFLPDEVLFYMPGSFDNPYDPTDDQVLTKALHNFLSTLGESLEGYGIFNAVTELTAFTQNYKALDAVTDYLTQQQLENIIPFTGFNLNFSTQGIVQNITQYDGDLFTGANAVRDLMHKIGGSLDLYDFYENEVLGAASEFVYWTGELGAFGVDAVLGELPTHLLTPYILSELEADQYGGHLLADAGITLGTTSGETMTGSDLVNDKFIALAGNDTLYGYGGDDQLYGDDGKDTLYGGLGNDLLHGGAGKDTLYGEEGDDIIFGGTGADTLYGGTGADTFWFDANDKGTGIDVIKDFSILEGDKINISDVLEQYDPYTDLLSQFVRLTESGSDTLLQVDMTGPGVPGGFATLARIEGVTGLDLDTLVNNGTIVV